MNDINILPTDSLILEKESKKAEDAAKRKKREEEYIEIKKIMDDYHSGDEELRQDAMAAMIEKLQNFIRSIIKKTFGTYTSYYNDLFQEGCYGILKAMDNYDPDKSRPTTYFKIYIIHEMTKFIDVEVNHTSSHYSSNIAKIAKIIDVYEQKGIKWTEQDLAIETGLTLETVTQCLRIKIRSNEKHYESGSDHIFEDELSDRSQSPEEAYLEREKNEAIYTALETLDEDERMILCYRLGLMGYNSISFKDTAERIHIPVDKVRKTYYKAIRKLRNKPQLRHVFHDYLQAEESRTIQNTEIPLIPQKQAVEVMDILASNMA